MKYLVLIVVLFLTSCATTTKSSEDVELVGRLIGSYVSTPTGMYKGSILNVSDGTSIEKISNMGNGNAQIVLLNHSVPDKLSEFSGTLVKVSGHLKAEHVDMFHTDFTLYITEISAM